MNYIEIIGFSAATLTTVSFFPQVLKIWKSKSAKDISLGTFLIMALGLFLWLLYGIFKVSFPIIAANVVSLGLVFIILIFKLRY